ncbi:hypothetical protein RJO15_26310 [Herbaspirillum huttiense F1]|uniref:hypothetical protein n=1 Tax=Herbaspirillum huttiense TaxID=863372 RepID=UPI002888B192|nr:hypothetical protein [Herbaspirillum huttiense]MDT0359326.1 hypothetical protein [Herbaspirillum huttiense F1]
MNAEDNFKIIRGLTRIALPIDNNYIFRLGTALYSFASICSFMVEVASHLDPTVNRTDLETKMAGKILERFREAVRAASVGVPTVEPLGAAVADLFEELNSQRSDFVHAYPITNNSDVQILHRRLDKANKYFEVTNEFLDGFISRIHDVSDQLYAIRKIMRPELGG